MSDLLLNSTKMRNPSIATLMRLTDVQTAKLLRYVLTADIDKVEAKFPEFFADLRSVTPHRHMTDKRTRQHLCDCLLKTQGIECINGTGSSRQLRIDYLNTGETYDLTLIWHHRLNPFGGVHCYQVTVGDWGSWAENHCREGVQ